MLTLSLNWLHISGRKHSNAVVLTMMKSHDII